jgi:hypothetical protein
MKVEQEETIICECDCKDPEHILMVNYFPDEDYTELYLSVQLTQHRSFLKRCWVALKYIFGYECKYGHWDCHSFKKENVKALVTLFNKYLAREK